MIINPISIEKNKIKVLKELFDAELLTRIFVIGNGGSYANAIHLASDLREIGYDTDALNNPSNITAIANDFGYEEIFREQLKQKYLSSYDILIAISGSGNSKNILNAVEYAQDIGTPILVITMDNKGKLKQYETYKLLIDTEDMEDFETTTLGIIHAIKKLLK